MPFESTGVLGSTSFLEQLLAPASLTSVLPELGRQRSPALHWDTPVSRSFVYIDPFTIEGHITSMLVAGRAYTPAQADITITEAESLARTSRRALFGDGFYNVRVWMSTGSWAPWFWDSA